MCADVLKQCNMKRECFFQRKLVEVFNDYKQSIEMKNNGEWNEVLAPDSVESVRETNKLKKMVN